MDDKDQEIESLKRRLAALEGSAKTTPPPNAPSTPSPNPVATGCLIIIVLIVVLMVVGMCSGGGKSGSTTVQNSSCDDDTMAFVMSQDFVKSRLKSPRKAHFPYMTEQGVSVSKSGLCEFTVIAYVDAQNGFGAEIRTPYVAVVQAPETGDTWLLKSLVLE